MSQSRTNYGPTTNSWPRAESGWGPEYFADLPARRALAFLIDAAVITVPIAFGLILIFLLGFLTLGLAWMLYLLVPVATTIWAIAYYAYTLGGRASATIGMRVMEIEMRTWTGEPAYSVLGAVHAILFWISVTTLTPLVLLVAFFNGRHRLLHDIVLGTVVINTEPRASALRGATNAMH